MSCIVLSGRGAPQLTGGKRLPHLWFPDARLTDARALIGHPGVKLLGQAAVSFPVSKKANTTDNVTAGTALLDTYVPLPVRYRDSIEITTREGGRRDTVVRTLRYTMFHLRVATNLAVEPAAVGERAAQKGISSPDQGFVNAQASRFIVGVGGADALTTAFVRGIGGVALQQIRDSAATTTTYETSVFLAAQAAIHVLIPQSDTGTIAAAHLLIAVEPYIRWIPDSLAAVVGSQRKVIGVTGRFYVWTPKVKGLGIAVTYRDMRRVRLAPGVRWSLEAIVTP
jgi:hypothetical protein